MIIVWTSGITSKCSHNTARQNIITSIYYSVVVYCYPRLLFNWLCRNSRGYYATLTEWTYKTHLIRKRFENAFVTGMIDKESSPLYIIICWEEAGRWNQSYNVFILEYTQHIPAYTGVLNWYNPTGKILVWHATHSAWSNLVLWMKKPSLYQSC